MELFYVSTENENEATYDECKLHTNTLRNGLMSAAQTEELAPTVILTSFLLCCHHSTFNRLKHRHSLDCKHITIQDGKEKTDGRERKGKDSHPEKKEKSGPIISYL